MRPGIMDVLNEWGPEGATMEKVVAATDDAEKEKLLRGYLAHLKNTDQVVKRWMLDVKYVLDQLPKSGAGSALAARLDLSRLGVAGHSMGGVMAGQFCVEDRRCKAALNLDGIPQYGTMIDTPMPAPFLMVYSGRPGRAGASDLIYRPLGIEVLPRRRRGHAAHRLHRHESSGAGRCASAARSARSRRSARPS